jgi:hypothetical protein
VYLRRLTHREYVRSVRDALGVDVSALAASFPTEYVLGGFDNSAVEQSISKLHAPRYYDAAAEIAAQVMADPVRVDSVVGCDPDADPDGCAREFAERTGRRLYRRALARSEVERLAALAGAAPSPREGIAWALQAMLQSPNFLFRVERGAADPERPELLKLTGYEVASRLAFFLLGTAPDEALLAAAESGELDSADGIEAAARALLGEPALEEALLGFAEQWFRLRRLDEIARDPARFPEFGAALVESMRAELRQLLADHMFGEGSSFLDVYTTRTGYVDEQLALIYGVTAAGTALAPHDFADDADRGGLLTSAGLLTLSTRGNDTSPIHRGVYVRDVVLCDPPPPPVPNIVPPVPAPGESFADAEERHRAMEPCKSCHTTIDPVGHGLERYDAIGRLRETYDNGEPVRQMGMLPDGTSYGGGVELGAIVSESAQARGCVTRHLFRWAMGRPEARADACTLDELDQRFDEAEFGFEALVLALVRSDAFRYRRPHESEGP